MLPHSILITAKNKEPQGGCFRKKTNATRIYEERKPTKLHVKCLACVQTKPGQAKNAISETRSVSCKAAEPYPAVFPVQYMKGIGIASGKSLWLDNDIQG